MSYSARCREADTAIYNDRNLLPYSSMQTLVATNPALQKFISMPLPADD